MFGHKNVVALFALGVLSSACVTTELAETNKATTASSNKSNPVTESPSVPTSIAGGYQNDGPCPNPPADLDTRPDAQPRVEAYLSGPNRPYVALGQRYVPEVSQRAFRQTGKASWYGCKYQGQTTSSGEIFDTYQMTAAHPILPIPSYVRVTNLENQKSVVVRINDRGPFVANRVIDLSYLAARRIGLVDKGTADVEVERLFPLGIAPEPANAPAQVVAVIPTVPSPAPATPSKVVPTAVTPAPVAPTSVVMVPAQTPPAVTSAPVATTAPTPVKSSAPQVYLQFGAFLEAGRAEQERARLTQKLSAYPLNVIVHSGLHKIVRGPFASTAAAQQEKAVLQAKKITTFIVAY